MFICHRSLLWLGHFERGKEFGESLKGVHPFVCCCCLLFWMYCSSIVSRKWCKVCYFERKLEGVNKNYGQRIKPTSTALEIVDIKEGVQESLCIF